MFHIHFSSQHTLQWTRMYFWPYLYESFKHVFLKPYFLMRCCLSSAVSHWFNSYALHKKPQRVSTSQTASYQQLSHRELFKHVDEKKREKRITGLLKYIKASFSNDVAKLQLVLGAFHPAVIDPTCRSGTQWLPCVAVTLPPTHWPFVHSITSMENYLYSLRGQLSDVNKGNIWWGEVMNTVYSYYHSAWNNF